MRAAQLLEQHPEVWRGATSHRFLDGVREGTLPREAFTTWLVQDYLFVADGLVFLSRLISRSPRRDQGLLVGGLSALESELGWFEEQAVQWNLDLSASRHPTTRAYTDFLLSLEAEPYPAGITALWALERAYLEAWRNASPGHPDYREFVEHWTTPEFADYVGGLEQAADAALQSASEQGRKQAEDAFLEVARLEHDFWEMAFSGGGG